MRSRQRPRPLPAGAPPPRVSVVVPCYSYGHYLPACIGSIVDQPDVDVDVLIVDDASPDGSGEVAEALAAQHSSVRVIRHTTNAGHIATYNEGLAQVTGDYIVLLSADDLLCPGALGRATALMEANPDVGMTYGHPIAFSTETPPPARTTPKSWSIWSGPEWVSAQFRRGMSIVYSPEAVVRASVHHAVGYYLPELPHSGDMELWLRIAAVSDIGRVNGVDQAYRREHPTSMMHTLYGTVLKDLQTRDEAFETFLTTAGARFPNVASLRNTAQRSNAREALYWASTLSSRTDPDPDGARAGEIGECVAYAREIYPDYRTLAAWREYQRMTDGPRNTLDRLAGRADAVRRDLAGRIRWQRWYRLGV